MSLRLLKFPESPARGCAPPGRSTHATALTCKVALLESQYPRAAAVVEQLVDGILQEIEQGGR